MMGAAVPGPCRLGIRAPLPAMFWESAWALCFADILWPLLRGNQPLQATAHLLGENRRHVQGQEAARDAAPHLRHR